jgi:hypothetical protein
VTLGLDFKWPITADLAVETDPRASYLGRIERALTCNGLWYAPTWGRDVRQYLLDVATDSQIAIEIQQTVEADEETQRAEVSVSREGGSVAVEIAAYTKRGAVVRFTLAIDAVTGALVVNP